MRDVRRRSLADAGTPVLGHQIVDALGRVMPQYREDIRKPSLGIDPTRGDTRYGSCGFDRTGQHRPDFLSSTLALSQRDMCENSGHFRLPRHVACPMGCVRRGPSDVGPFFHRRAKVPRRWQERLASNTLHEEIA
jgi:hypothetical protein